VDGSVEDGRFTAWLSRDGRPTAAMLVGRPQQLAAARDAIAQASETATLRSAA